jgi:hypothetical protein
MAAGLFECRLHGVDGPNGSLAGKRFADFQEEIIAR